VNAAGDRIYVAQTAGDKTVKIVDGRGTPIGDMKPPAIPASDHVPVYVAVNPANGDVYVSDRVTAKIYVYSADGVYRRTFDPGKDRNSWLPLGIGFGGDGTMYVTDLSMPMKVHQFAPDGAWVRTIQPDNPFSYPNGIWPDTKGNIYVSDSNNGRLRVFAADGREEGGIPRGARAGDLGLPRGVTVDDESRVYVVDTSAHAVQVYKALGPDDRRPGYVGNFGGQGSADAQFEFPNGVAVDARGHVIVTDLANNRVQVWSY
jgi:sugar lactone lactonase YvrE